MAGLSAPIRGFGVKSPNDKALEKVLDAIKTLNEYHLTCESAPATRAEHASKISTALVGLIDPLKDGVDQDDSKFSWKMGAENSAALGRLLRIAAKLNATLTIHSSSHNRLTPTITLPSNNP